MTDVAEDYDRHHGGPARAVAAARSVATLLGPTDRVLERVLDLGVGPGTVARHLPGRVVGLDLDPGRLAAARHVLPVLRADAVALPVRDATLDAVVGVWALHLVEDTDAVVAEVARVLRPGGLLVTTVDKQLVDHHVGRRTSRPMRGDAMPVLVTLAARHGLVLCGATSFTATYDDDIEATYPVLALRS